MIIENKSYINKNIKDINENIRDISKNIRDLFLIMIDVFWNKLRINFSILNSYFMMLGIANKIENKTFFIYCLLHIQKGKNH